VELVFHWKRNAWAKIIRLNRPRPKAAVIPFNLASYNIQELSAGKITPDVAEIFQSWHSRNIGQYMIHSVTVHS
jgi:hypothetical protein